MFMVYCRLHDKFSALKCITLWIHFIKSLKDIGDQKKHLYFDVQAFLRKHFQVEIRQVRTLITLSHDLQKTCFPFSLFIIHRHGDDFESFTIYDKCKQSSKRRNKILLFQLMMQKQENPSIAFFHIFKDKIRYIMKYRYNLFTQFL